MTPTLRSNPPGGWLLPAVALVVGVLGLVAAWLAVSLFFSSPCGWVALLAALDMALMLRLAGAPPGRRRAALAVLGTLVAIVLGYWMIAATQMGLLLGLAPLESAQRLGPVLAGELTRHATNGWDVAWALLALPLAWRVAR